MHPTMKVCFTGKPTSSLLACPVMRWIGLSPSVRANADGFGRFKAEAARGRADHHRPVGPCLTDLHPSAAPEQSATWWS
jgi:hypothetical protein